LRLLLLAGFLGAYVAATAVLALRYVGRGAVISPWEARAGWLYRDGSKLLWKAVGWDPTRPGELPWLRRPSLAEVDDDFARIRAAGFNGIRTWTPLSEDELRLAERHGLAVLQGIWVDRRGRFSDPGFRKRERDKVGSAVRASRQSPSVIGYLVLNEPPADHVLAEGIDATRAFLRELAQTVRRLHPGALVSFASWPGLEFLDDPALDVVAVNLYPFRPTALLRALGYAGMVRLWKHLLASERPLLVTEYGGSVAPAASAMESGLAMTEATQARMLPRLADSILRSGAAGAAVFQWSDGWWKNADRPGDEQAHDEDDPEEWFGLVAFGGPGDRRGRARPALAAMQAWNRAVLTLPRDGPISNRTAEVEVFTEEEGALRVEASANGGAPVAVPLARKGPWLRGHLVLPARASGPQRVVFAIVGPGGVVSRAERILLLPGDAPALSLSVEGRGARRAVVARVRDGRGRPIAGAEVRVAIADASQRHDRSYTLVSDGAGEARVDVLLPPPPAIALLAGAVRGREEEPPLAIDARLVHAEEVR
jgi:hypothetical protein